MKKKQYPLFGFLIMLFCSSIYGENPYQINQGIPEIKHGRPTEFFNFEAPIKGSVSFSAELLLLEPKNALLPKEGFSPAGRLKINMHPLSKDWGSDISFMFYEISSFRPLTDAEGNVYRKHLNVHSHFNLRDGEIALFKQFLMEPGFIIKLSGGLEAAHTKRFVDLREQNTILDESENTVSSLLGFGPLYALNIQKQLINGFSISGSLIQSTLRSRLRWENHKVVKFNTISKYGLGAEWTNGSDSDTVIHLATGYEVQYWRRETFVKSSKNKGEDDLRLKGFFFRGTMDY